MKKGAAKPKAVREGDEDEILPEYNFGNARKNPYAARLTERANVVILDPDVAKIFPDSASVNDALRTIIRRRTTSRGSS